MGAYEQTGQQVAILIDEYDSPLQHSWKTPQHEACTAIYREVFAILKADDKYEKFVFNPFSLINALADSDLKNYWASSGATSLLPKFVDDMGKGLVDWKEV